MTGAVVLLAVVVLWGLPATGDGGTPQGIAAVAILSLALVAAGIAIWRKQ